MGDLVHSSPKNTKCATFCQFENSQETEVLHTLEKKIQIPLSLYEAMVGYVSDHYDPEDRQRYAFICKGVEDKRKAEIRRNLYSGYKTQEEPEAREMLRQAYLDEAGIPSHGRWSEETEKQFREGNFNR